MQVKGRTEIWRQTWLHTGAALAPVDSHSRKERPQRCQGRMKGKAHQSMSRWTGP